MAKLNGLTTAERVQDLLFYNSITGEFTWRQGRAGTAAPGAQAGLRKKRGHLEIKVDGVRFMAHRLAWLWMTGEWPEDEIDHIDRNPGNNAWNNLRKATPAQNKLNRPCDPRSAIGLKGVTQARGREGKPVPGKFKAQIARNGTMEYLGTYKTPEEAHAVWKIAYLELHGPEFAHFE